MTTLHHRPIPRDAAEQRPSDPGETRVSPAADAEKESRKEPARLSLTQVVASGLAAVSTTVLLSVFGVAGTIIGAGLASVLTVVANFLYTRSIEKTHAQLKPVVGTIQAKTATARLAPQSGRRRDTAVLGTAVLDPVGPGTATASPSGPATEPLVSAPPQGAGGPAVRPSDETRSEQEAPLPRNAWLRLIEKHGRGRVLTVSALAVFLVVMGVVLVVELALGKPISDAVRGQEGTGTSISQLRHSTPTGSGTSDQEQVGSTQDVPAQDAGEQGTTSGGAGGQTEDPTTGGAAGAETEDTTTSDPTGTTTQEPTTDPTTEPTDPATGGTDGTGTDGTATDGTDTGTGTDDDTDASTGTGTEDDASTGDVQPGSGGGTSGGTSGDTSGDTESSGGSTPAPETTGSTTG
ncbi:hypothetical protein [Isoptericola sp. BMS4]|uniref:hypothetical protein n=1 Tax=Isoptericola sp. BMS4 TaxID=2527875 RepID=UPI001423B802|nr:hypothetical protein [Isoptericola sp. BMS4]